MRFEQLTQREVDTYEDALISELVTMRIEVTVRNQNEVPIGVLTAEPDFEKATYEGIPGVVEGQVDVDWAGDVTHQLRLVITDPKGQLIFDKDSPSRSGLFPDKFVSVVHETRVDNLGWVGKGVFWGPVTRFERDGAQVSIEGLGKESLALEPCVIWRTMKIPKGTLMTEAIKRLLREQGERRFSLPDIPRRLHKDLTVGRRAEPWRVCKRLANSVDRHLFYDGYGRVKMRRLNDRPQFVFKD